MSENESTRQRGLSREMSRPMPGAGGGRVRAEAGRGSVGWTDRDRTSTGGDHGKPRSACRKPEEQAQRMYSGSVDIAKEAYNFNYPMVMMHLQAIGKVARQLNERPRKTLGYHTPSERFAECVASTG